MENRLKHLRKLLNLTQEELAEELDISRQSLISLEKEKCLPSLGLAKEISEFFALPIEIIFKSPRRLELGRKEDKMKKKKQTNQPFRGKLTPWHPFAGISRLHDEIDRIFEESFPRLGDFEAETVFAPKVNVSETKENVLVEAEVPGMDEKDIDIEVTDSAVRISGERKKEKEVEKKNYYRRESSFGSFSRTVALPSEVKVAAAEAKMKNGTLIVTLPKKEIKGGEVKRIKPKKG